jgi:hypothetical protein
MVCVPKKKKKEDLAYLIWNDKIKDYYWNICTSFKIRFRHLGCIFYGTHNILKKCLTIWTHVVPSGGEIFSNWYLYKEG